MWLLKKYMEIFPNETCTFKHEKMFCFDMSYLAPYFVLQVKKGKDLKFREDLSVLPPYHWVPLKQFQLEPVLSREVHCQIYYG